MTHEEKTFAVILWLHENNIYEKFVDNVHKLNPYFDPFAEKELNKFLIAKSFDWMNTTEGIGFWNDVDNKYKEFYNNYIMKEKKEKSIKIDIPEGYEIDKEKSTFENIVFKKKEKCWRAKENPNAYKDINNIMSGYYIYVDSTIQKATQTPHRPSSRNVFATEKQAKSALAMAQISQIMEHDERFGGVVTDEEWEDVSVVKHTIERDARRFITTGSRYFTYMFLAFHTPEQRELFLVENKDLIKDYLML